MITTTIAVDSTTFETTSTLTSHYTAVVVNATETMTTTITSKTTASNNGTVKLWTV